MTRRIIVRMPAKYKNPTEQMIVCPNCQTPRANNKFNYPSKTDSICKWCLTDRCSNTSRENINHENDMRKRFINSCIKG